MNPEVTTIIDLGSGSSIPTLLAIKNSGRKDVRTIAVDIDPDAHEIGSENALSLGLNERLPEALLVSNPPYIATPEHLKEHSFIPVNGGVHGDEYLLKILRQSCERGANIAFLWGSLTSPNKLLPIIHENFVIRHTEAHRIHFGNYTKSEPLRTYLYRLRDQGVVYFEDTIDEGEVQCVFGSIIKKK